MGGLKRAVISIVSVATLVLVSSCGAGSSEASQGHSEPQYRVLDRFTVPELGGEVMVVCRHNDMYVFSDVYYGVQTQRFDNHEECK